MSFGQISAPVKPPTGPTAPPMPLPPPPTMPPVPGRFAPPAPVTGEPPVPPPGLPPVPRSAGRRPVPPPGLPPVPPPVVLPPSPEPAVPIVLPPCPPWVPVSGVLPAQAARTNIGNTVTKHHRLDAGMSDIGGTSSEARAPRAETGSAADQCPRH